jgi:prepilin-type N-terminal cleavage/methylation domain-containing protein
VDRRERGFSVLELVVAMAVMLLALLLACDLLDESARLLHHSVRRARDPLPLLASELLRNDLRAAEPIPGGVGIWDAGALPLVLPGQGVVVWSPRGNQLWRSQGGVDRQRLVGLRTWRWRALSPGAVEVELELEASGTWLTHSGGGRPRPDPGRRDVLRLLVANRGGQDGW